MKPTSCKSCDKPVLFLRCQTVSGAISGKPAPIEAAPSPNGNLVISREKGLYRFATPNEIEVARNHGKNLYVSHFSSCPGAEEFRGEKAKTV